MKSEAHLDILKQRGVAGWNQWREDNPQVTPELRRQSLFGLFRGESRPIAKKGYCTNLAGINLSLADLSGTFLEYANLTGANLTEANLDGANLADTSLIRAHLDRAILRDANLRRARLNGAHLRGANLMYAQLNGAEVSGADLTGANIYGISAWNVGVSEDTIQSNLKIEKHNEPSITVPSLEMAQFYYLLKDHKKLRDVIGAVIDRGALLLGRFTPERKEILDAVADKLRGMNYLPISADYL